MTSEPSSALSPPDAGEPLARKRRFAAKEQHLGWGISLGIAGAVIAGFNLLMAVGAVLTSESSSDTAVLVVFFGLFTVLGLAMLVFGIFLARGTALSPAAKAAKREAKAAEAARRKEAIEQQRAAEAARRAALKQAELDQFGAVLAAATGAAALVAHRNLEAAAKRLYPQESAAKLAEAVEKTGFDSRTVASPRFGYLNVKGGHLEVFRDFIVLGQQAYDVEPTTRGQVYTDGAVQVTQRVELDRRGRQQVVTAKHDLRTASIQFTSASWALQAEIHPDAVPLARQYVEQLATHVESLRPKNVTVADIREMVDAILSNTGQPPAEKIRQLSNLRYERLLSDAEFKKAKEKILGTQDQDAG